MKIISPLSFPKSISMFSKIKLTKYCIASLLFLFASVQTVFAQVPTITSISPRSGAIGSTVTITGTNFSATPSNNIVYFGSVRATVSSATTTQLRVTVPLGATTNKLVVTNLSSSRSAM